MTPEYHNYITRQSESREVIGGAVIAILIAAFFIAAALAYWPDIEIAFHAVCRNVAGGDICRITPL